MVTSIISYEAPMSGKGYLGELRLVEAWESLRLNFKHSAVSRQWCTSRQTRNPKADL
jgi:hypothetical protein